jgi:hypothetical protein
MALVADCIEIARFAGDADPPSRRGTRQAGARWSTADAARTTKTVQQEGE